MMTYTDDDTMIDEEMSLNNYETPTEEVEDRRSNDTAEDRLDLDLPDGDVSSSLRHVEDEWDGSDRRSRVGNEDLVVTHGQGTGIWSVASGNIALVESNRAPVLRKMDRKAILKFVDARDRYLRSFRDAASTGQPRSLVSMIEITVLETLCECDLGMDVKDVTDHDIESWINRALIDDRSQDSQIAKKMKKMRMDLKVESPGLRVNDLYVQFNKIVKDNGWKHIFEDEDGKKLKIRYLVNAIEPKELKTMIKSKLRVEPRFAKQPVAFLALLRKKATNQEETRTIRMAEQDDKKKESCKRHRTDEKERVVKINKPHEKKSGERDRSQMKCFRCGKLGHPAFKCMLNRERMSKKEVHETLKKNDNTYKKKSNYLLVCRIGCSRDEKKHIDVKISEGLYVPGILDSGSTDMSLIPLRIAQMAMRNDPSIVAERLREPIRLRLGDNQTEVEATECVRLDIGLRTKAGEIVTRQRKCLIWDVPSDEIILGCGLLAELGIEPKTALDALIVSKRQKTNDSQVEHEEPPPDERENPEDDDDITFEQSSSDEIEEGVNNLIKTAQLNGLPYQWVKRLSRLVRKYKDVWRTSLGPDPPAKVTPFVTRLFPNAKPYKCKGRRYNSEDSVSLQQFIDELVKNGLVEKNPNSEWASPVVVVKKSDGSRRMCVDLRAVNSVCESTAWPMPFLEAIVNDLAGSRFWFKLDAFKGSWMMPLAEECREMFSFMTDRGVYTPKRSIQGALNSATQFQARMTEVFQRLIKNSLVIWIDDLLGYAESFEKWFSTLEETLRLAAARDIKFNLKKCDLFTRRVKFCGTICSPDGVRHDPDRIEALIAMPQPQTARDL